jgi:hypothetical protein
MDIKCEICGKSLEPVVYPDGIACENHDRYDYRGRTACGYCLDTLIAKVDNERAHGIFKEG